MHHDTPQKIMQAAGKDVTRYWDQYPFHHQNHIYSILEQYKIGILEENEYEEEESDMDDPFKNDPKRSGFIVHTQQPFNAEPSLSDLYHGGHITPTKNFFIRHHFPVPSHPNTLTLTINNQTKVFTVEELKELDKENHVEHTVTLQCAGNRRSAMHNERETQGIQWNSAAISTGLFGGIPLALLLSQFDTLVYDKNAHLVFGGSDG